jgi:hypothetical protein
MAFLDDGQGCQTQFRKWTTYRQLEFNFTSIGSIVSEENILKWFFLNNLICWTTPCHTVQYKFQFNLIWNNAVMVN